MQEKKGLSLEFIKSVITDIPADLSSSEAQYYREKLVLFPEEAVYVLSLKERKLLYVDGWKDVLGYEDEEMTVMKVVSSNIGQYASFAAELNVKALLFTLSLEEDHEQYSFVMEVKKRHKDGHDVPIISRVGIVAAEDGSASVVIARFQVNRSLRFGKVITFSTYGPRAEEFHEMLNEELFDIVTVSEKEKEAVQLVSQGYSFKEIASQLGVSQSAIEKRILPMYKRFGVKSLSHLIAFCYKNNII